MDDFILNLSKASKIQTRQDLIIKQVVDLFRDINSYIKSPRSYPNPLKKISKMLKNVNFDLASLKFKYLPSSVYELDSENQVPTLSNYSKNVEIVTGYLIILKEIFQCLSTNNTIKKREIYYKWVDFFEEQSSVDYIISRISFLLEIPRSLLNIVNQNFNFLESFWQGPSSWEPPNNVL